MPKFKNNQFKQLNIKATNGENKTATTNPFIPYVGFPLKFTGTILNNESTPISNENGIMASK